MFKALFDIEDRNDEYYFTIRLKLALNNYLEEKGVDYQVDSGPQAAAFGKITGRTYPQLNKPYAMSIVILEAVPKFYHSVLIPGLRDICEDFRVRFGILDHYTWQGGEGLAALLTINVDWDYVREGLKCEKL